MGFIDRSSESGKHCPAFLINIRQTLVNKIYKVLDWLLPAIKHATCS